MFWIIENLNASELVLLSISPLLALLMFRFSKKGIIVILIISCLLLIPICFGYDFILSWFYELCFTVVLGVCFFYLVKKIRKRMSAIIVSVMCSILLFIFLGLTALLGAFAGGHERNRICNLGEYKIIKCRSYGFAGRHVISYELYHSIAFGLYHKKVTKISDDPFNPGFNCLYKYSDYGLIFDKCKSEMKYLPN